MCLSSRCRSRDAAVRNWVVVSLLLLFFLLEGALLPWLLPFPRAGDFFVAPRLVLVTILFVSVLRNRHLGLLLGLVFGLMQDIVYDSPMLGAHGFSMAVAAYAAGSVRIRAKTGITFFFVVLLYGLAFYELAVYALYRLFLVMDLTLVDFLARQFAPTLLVSLLLAVLLYVPARKWLPPLPDKRDEEAA